MMRRKMLTLLLCVSMTAAIFAGCGTKNADTGSNKTAGNSSAEQNTVKVTKKLEEEYVARIEAY